MAVAKKKRPKPPPLKLNLGGKGPSKLPKINTGTKSKSAGSEEKALKAMLAKHGLSKYFSMIVAAAKTYHLSAVELGAALVSVGQTHNGVGIANIRDGSVNGAYNSSHLVLPSGGGAKIITNGTQITRAMKDSPMFSIFYLAWRIQGNMVNRGMTFQAAVGGPRGYDPAAGNPNQYIPKNYTPSSSNATGGVNTTALASSAKGLTASGTDPFVVYNKKTGKLSYQTVLTGHVLTYDGVPITRSQLMAQTQDKAGIGGDYYNFTGRRPTPHAVAAIMATGRNLQQVENSWINDTKHFKNSPAGKKYYAGYQDAWSQIMGKNQPVPWKLVAEAAQDNLDETEFAAKLRMDGFKGQKQNPQWSYLQSNEYDSKVDAYTLSYEKIYGESLKDTGMKQLASDAALAGWDDTQWEAYLRSLPQYTHTYEYQGHAMGLLNQLGMDFGFVSGLGANGITPTNPMPQLEAPAPDKRVDNGKAPVPGSAASNNLGVVIPNA